MNTVYTIKQLETASTKWPLEVQEQLQDVHDRHLNDDCFDWMNADWKLIDFDITTDLSKFNKIHFHSMNKMLLSYRLDIDYDHLIDNMKRHNSIRQYILTHGTWPVPPVVRNKINLDSNDTSKSDRLNGWSLADGNHRFSQLLDLYSLFSAFDQIMDFERARMFHENLNNGWVDHINTTHKIWFST